MNERPDQHHIDRTAATIFQALVRGSASSAPAERTKIVAWIMPPPECPSPAPDSGARSTRDRQSATDEAVRREWRRIGRRWQAEHGFTSDSIVHHEHRHIHEVASDPSTRPERIEIIDAEVVGDSGQPGLVPSLLPASQPSLSQRSADEFDALFQQTRRRSTS